MRVAALYVQGKIVTASSHLEAFQQLSPEEQNCDLTSGAFDDETGEFQSDLQKDHFYDKKIILIRHGHVEKNGLDPSLSEKGLKDVSRLSEYLNQFDLSKFIGLTSPFLRCLQTAEIISKLTQIDFEVKNELLEPPPELPNFDLKNRYLEFNNFEWSNHTDIHINDESNVDFKNRVHQVLQKLPRRCIIISHSGFIINMASLALSEQK